MKNIKYILIIIFLVKSLNIFSQGEFVIEIDRANGTFIKTGPEIAGITYIYPNTRAYDENNGLFIFPSADNPTRLYSIDVNNDSIIYSPVYNNLLVEFEFCNSTNTMYGLLKDNLSNVKFLASIDPKTGISTVIGDTIPDSGTFSGLSAFDQTNNRYIYLDGANKIVSIDASHGNIVSNPILVLEGSEYLVSMSCDETNEILNGMIFNSTENKNYFVSINTSTGAVIKIGSGMTLGNIGSSAIDQNNGQFIFLYENSIGSYAIATVNISTGELVYNNLIQTFDLDNFYSLKYDNIRRKLYSIHWDCYLSLINEHTNNIELHQNGPNPFDKNTVIRYSIPENIQGEAFIVFYDLQGNMVKRFKVDRTSNTLLVSTSDFIAGTYYYQLQTGSQSSEGKKIVVIE